MRGRYPMKQYIIILMICLITIFRSSLAICDEKTAPEKPWEKYSINLGAFISSTDTNFRVGSGVGISLDMEKILDFDSTNNVFRVDGSWRFTKNLRHRLDLSWFSYNLSGTKTAEVDIPIEDGITAGQTLDAYFDLDIYQVRYSYSFLQDDRLDLAAKLGLYVMPIKFGLRADGLIVGEGEAKFTAPLPTIGFRMDIALTPKWFVRTGTQFFYLEYEQFKGAIASMGGAIEYMPWKHLGFGLGIDSLRIEVEAEGEDYPGIDFSGDLEFNYVGLQLYARFAF
jgi:hypothetical protein